MRRHRPMPCAAPFGGVDRQPIHRAPVRQRGLHAERAGNDDGVYRGAFKLGERQCLDRHTFGGDDRSTVKAVRMPGVAMPWAARI